MKFRAMIELNGKTATGIEVPAAIVEELGAGKKPAVRVTLRGYSYRTTIGSMGGRSLIPVSAEHRGGAGVAAGDEVEVEIELDAEPRELTVPADFQAALEAEPAAKTFFEGLSYSNKRRFTLQVEEAKTAETRSRRIEKFVGMLKAGKAQ